jgi:hypothetical protein
MPQGTMRAALRMGVRVAARVGVAFLAFKCGVMVYYVIFGYGMAYIVPIERVRARWQEDIAETVYRYEIEHFTPVETAVYYLSYSNDNDPGVETMQNLKADKLRVRRLSELGTFPITNSGCYYCPTGETEFILRVGSIRWLNDNEVLVGGSLRRWEGNVDRAYLFHVVRKGRWWIVKDHELL